MEQATGRCSQEVVYYQEKTDKEGIKSIEKINYITIH